MNREVRSPLTKDQKRERMVGNLCLLAVCFMMTTLVIGEVFVVVRLLVWLEVKGLI